MLAEPYVSWCTSLTFIIKNIYIHMFILEKLENNEK